MTELKETQENLKEIKKIKKHINDYKTGYLSGVLNYRFRTYDFLSIIFLYKNSVDYKTPDLLSKQNKNNFVNEILGKSKKIKEQIRLELKDINFLVKGFSELASYTVKAANRKVLKSNEFSEVLNLTVDDGVDYGSGFVKVWKDSKGKLKIKNVDPFKIIFNQSSFKDGIKTELINTTFQKIQDNKKYDEKTKIILLEKLGGDIEKIKNKDLTLYQSVQPIKFDEDGEILKSEITVVDVKNEVILFKGEVDGQVYFKWDYEKRRGFKDALGLGIYESLFNVLVSSKKNRERLDRLLEVVTKQIYQKKVDNIKDKYIGKQVTGMKDAQIMGYMENKIEPVHLGGGQQVAFLKSELSDLSNLTSEHLNIHDVLQGKTLPAGTSGVLGNLLNENSSSVHKDVQKSYARFIDRIYRKEITPYILSIFTKEDNLSDYLEETDVRFIKENVRNYLMQYAEIESVIKGEVYNYTETYKKINRELEGKKLLSGELLKQLQKEVKGIETLISGEKISKAKSVAFIREMRNTYLANPQAFQDKTFIKMYKKEAEIDGGIEPLEFDYILRDLQNQNIQQLQTQQPVQQE